MSDGRGKAAARVIADAMNAWERDEIDDSAIIGFRLMATAFAMKDAHQPGAVQRLARAAFHVDSRHHFWLPEGQTNPVCLCGFVGSARKRTQTEHITSAVLEEVDHD